MLFRLVRFDRRWSEAPKLQDEEADPGEERKCPEIGPTSWVARTGHLKN
jgi:hypothetical protein